MFAMAQEPARILAVRDSVFSQEKYQWSDGAATFWSRLGEWYRGLVEFLQNLEHSHPLVHTIVTWGLLLILFGLILHVVLTVFRALRFKRAVDDESTLELEVRGASWHLSLARQLAAKGQYREAIAHRFIAAAKQLGDQHRLTYHPSKTPLEYLAEIESPPVQEQLREVVRDLYTHLFGDAGADIDTWTSFDATLTGLEANASSF